MSKNNKISNNANILVLNSGSSSLKFAIINIDQETTILKGIAEKLYTKQSIVSWKFNNNNYSKNLSADDHSFALEEILKIIKKCDISTNNILGIGHRVVHGGNKFISAEIINNEILKTIKSCSNLAPLHNPANIIGIETAIKLFPGLKNVAVFDTAYHQTMPEKSYIYPLPYEWYTKFNIRKYGFHGTSHKYVCNKAKSAIKDINKIITLHLGNGCSATATLNGKSIDTTMGFTPLEGLVMGTRCGDIDPGIIDFIADNLNFELEEIFSILNKKSGLLGISQISNDMRTLEKKYQEKNQQAILAIEIFCYRLAKHIASLSIPLQGIDALVFTGGIGENSFFIREKTVEYLKHLNFFLDNEHNQTNGINNKYIISDSNSNPVLVIPTDEELMIALETANLIRGF